MDLFDMIARYFWLIMLLQAVLWRFDHDEDVKDRLQRDPVFAEERGRILRWFRILYSVPWLVMGFGQIVGGVPSFWHFFRPQDMNPYVLAFWASVVFFGVLFAYWVFLRDGASTLADQGLVQAYGFGRRKKLDTTGVKLVSAIMLAGTVAVILSMVT